MSYLKHPGRNLDHLDAKEFRAQQLEAARLKAIHLRKLDSDLPISVIAMRVGRGDEMVKRWLREAGLNAKATPYWGTL